MRRIIVEPRIEEAAHREDFYTVVAYATVIGGFKTCLKAMNFGWKFLAQHLIDRLTIQLFIGIRQKE